jgi:DNA repair protein RadC
MALAVRYQSKPMRSGDQYTDSRQVFAHYHAQLSAKEEEAFICMMLDTKHRLIRDSGDMFRGTRNRSLAEPATIFKEALRHAASAVIFVHNHPSGDPTPSRDDEELTRRLRDAGELVGVRVLDHVIIGAEKYFSFADMGRL